MKESQHLISSVGAFSGANTADNGTYQRCWSLNVVNFSSGPNRPLLTPPLPKLKTAIDELRALSPGEQEEVETTRR